MKITVNLELDEVPLWGRRCINCGHSEFRAVTFIPYGMDEITKRNPQIMNYYNMIVNPHSSGAPTSQSSIPLAICLTCKHLVMLI